MIRDEFEAKVWQEYYDETIRMGAFGSTATAYANRKTKDRMRHETLKASTPWKRMESTVIFRVNVLNWFHTKWICLGGGAAWYPSESYDVRTREEVMDY